MAMRPQTAAGLQLTVKFNFDQRFQTHSTVPSNRENRYFIRLDVVSIGQIVLRVSAFYLLNWLSNRPDVLFFIFIQQEDTDTNSGNRTSNF